jgi:4-azaleucine resistance transporter AzlC
MRAGLPLVLPTLAIGISFGVLAQPVMGSIAPVVMSLIVFSGAAQFAALTVLTAGGGAFAAIAAGMLMNGRWLPMGLAMGPFLSGGPLKRAAQSLALVDASFALSSRGDGTYDRGVLIGATLPQAVAWTGGTLIGVLTGAALADPASLGLDAMFPAFFAVLLVGEARGRLPLTAAAAGAAIALVLMPFAPPGVPVLAAAAAALLGLRGRPAAARVGATSENDGRGGAERGQAAAGDGATRGVRAERGQAAAGDGATRGLRTEHGEAAAADGATHGTRPAHGGRSGPRGDLATGEAR